MTAQDRYRAMLRDEIAPALRSRGFKGSGTRYVLPDDTHWLQVGFQSSRWNSPDSFTFTVNLAAADKAAWARLAAERGYSDRPSPSTRYGPEYGFARLGTLAFGADRWWPVTDASHQGPEVTAEIIAAIDRVGLPWLRSKGAIAT